MHPTQEIREGHDWQLSNTEGQTANMLVFVLRNNIPNDSNDKIFKIEITWVFFIFQVGHLENKKSNKISKERFYQLLIGGQSNQIF